MANEKINLNNCTKEQIIEVVKAAKERKLAWEKRVQSEMKKRQEQPRYKAMTLWNIFQ